MKHGRCYIKNSDFVWCDYQFGRLTIVILDNMTDEVESFDINFCPICGFQPERSKREDPEMGCGALNIVETQ